jgi:hypothetical protein
MNDATPAVLALTAGVLAVLRFRVACAFRVRAWTYGGAIEAPSVADALAALAVRGAKVVSYGMVRGETQEVEQIVIVPFPGKKGDPTRYVVDLIPVMS